MKNILSFDIEEYFQVENLKASISKDNWKERKSRLHIGTDKILDILAAHNVKATFFILAWTAEQNPDLIKKIADQGHEIGSHGYAHNLIYKHTQQEFRDDLEKSLGIIEKITGEKVVSFRAPSFSITEKSLWALDILMEYGIQFDSSIFPIVHDRYGIPDSDRLPHIIREKDGKVLKEFPISTIEILGRKIPFSGGGYFRLLPTSLITKWTKELNHLGFPAVVYLHPWEFDPDQPRVQVKNPINSFRHYLNIDKTESKLHRFLEQVDCGPLRGYQIQDEGTYLKTKKSAHFESRKCQLSVVIPLYNEEESVPELVKQVTDQMEKINPHYEMILVDDGSKDKTVDVVKEQRRQFPKIKLVKLKRNYGQTPAMVAGFDQAEGDIIITLDGDLQNEPKDIRKLLDKIDEGYDVVSGWRKNRKDKFLTRTLPSMVANYLISKVTSVHLHDYGCSLKAYRTSVIQSLNAYGDMHRFFPAVASITGAKTAEVIVGHHPRKYGVSKYGLERIFKVLADLITIHLITKFSTKPMKYFGFLAFVFLGLSLFLGLEGVLSYFFFKDQSLQLVFGLSFLSFFLSFHFVILGLLCTLVIYQGAEKTDDMSQVTAQEF